MNRQHEWILALKNLGHFQQNENLFSGYNVINFVENKIAIEIDSTKDINENYRIPSVCRAIKILKYEDFKLLLSKSEKHIVTDIYGVVEGYYTSHFSLCDNYKNRLNFYIRMKSGRSLKFKIKQLVKIVMVKVGLGRYLFDYFVICYNGHSDVNL